ncbi:cation diffusion facilitator family transporter [Methanocella conradii]|uniref:cation diffusion facilitator family transporter n=1 Tax=Methanocella conradii TaxID=1175444 RepID=UPI0024B37F54|nr:cation diffusion facilitator family transporter [Methanocella conradii]MDI6897721.1 cation diffusion facilitator family transporter [Methanocella conradii]
MESEGAASDKVERANQLKRSTARLSILSNTMLVIMKLAVGFAIGSVSVISEAIHSGIDLVAALIAYFSVKKSGEPPDEGHQFGHGKFEDFSGLIEALLIFIAAILIIREAALKLMGQGEGLDISLLAAGIAVMLVSALANWYVSSRLMKAAKATESIALEADAWHLRTDVYTSLGIFAGLVLINLTGWKFLDPLFAIAVALFIMKAAYDLTRRATSDLVDTRLPEAEEERIKSILSEHYLQYAGFHELRTRKSGSDRFMDLHLVVPRNQTVSDAHHLSDHLEADLREEFPRSSITIHFEPCDGECDKCECNSTCKSRNGS